MRLPEDAAFFLLNPMGQAGENHHIHGLVAQRDSPSLTGQRRKFNVLSGLYPHKPHHKPLGLPPTVLTSEQAAHRVRLPGKPPLHQRACADRRGRPPSRPDHGMPMRATAVGETTNGRGTPFTARVSSPARNVCTMEATRLETQRSSVACSLRPRGAVWAWHSVPSRSRCKVAFHATCKYSR